MWPMTFQLPPGLPHESAQQLQWSCLGGGPDNMPWPTNLRLQGGVLTLTRQVEDSGFLAAPWPVEGHGQLMGTSATLMVRSTPYQLLVELARGKVNQVRSQAADWEAGGLQISPDLRASIRQATHTFGDTVCAETPEDTYRIATQALKQGYASADALVRAYINQVFQIRHHRKDQLIQACRLDASALEPANGPHITQAFNRVILPLSWHVVEAEETVYNWDEYDRLLDWAEKNGLEVTAGPLIDFSSSQLPAWLWLWENDLPSLATFMGRFVEAAVRRYRTRIRRWQLTAASNWANVLSLTEEELMALTFRLGEAAGSVDPSLELVVGVTQPWGEYMAGVERTYSPFIFADHLIRSGLNVSGLNLEVVMGIKGRGSYSRDLLETSRLFDLYALLGKPLHVTIGYPASKAGDPDADPELTTDAGWWKGGVSPEGQADWASAFSALALCKPFVQSVQWCHFSDAQPHQFPSCGLLDGTGAPRPALASLRRLYDEHVR